MDCSLSAGHATSTSASRCSKLPSSTKSGWPRQNEKKPSEVGSDELPRDPWGMRVSCPAETGAEHSSQRARAVQRKPVWPSGMKGSRGQFPSAFQVVVKVFQLI